ncbi:hypothetical protein Bca101_006939 [Brassica carinata]
MSFTVWKQAQELTNQARATTKVRNSRRHSGLTTGQPKIPCQSAKRRSSPEPKAPNALLCNQIERWRILHDGPYTVHLRET